MRLEIINEINNNYSIFIHLKKFVKTSYLNKLNEIEDWKQGDYSQQRVDRVQQFFHIHNEPFFKHWKNIAERWKSLPYYSWLLELQIQLQSDLDYILYPLYETYKMKPLNFKSALINKYRNGKDFIPAHFDTTEEIQPTIVSLSFGETRTFVVKRIVFGEENEISYKLEDGDIFIMSGLSQKNYTHEILPDDTINPRYNITFR